jgi:hypothetical protein
MTVRARRAADEPWGRAGEGGFVVVIPAFNEEPTIGPVVRAARRHAPVVVVDDGSTDGTAMAAGAAGAEVVPLPARRGKGAAVRAGVDMARRAGARWVLTIDGDGQHDPADIPRLAAVARRIPAAIVIGGRLASGLRPSVGRVNACRVAGFFIDWITGTSIRDTQSGFRCYPIDLFDQVGPRRGGFVLETELLVAGAWAGRPVFEVDIRVPAVPGRPSRFRPVADGCAVGAYLAARTLAHGLREAAAAAVEVARVFTRERFRARHATMAETCAPYAGAPHLYALAVGGVAAHLARARLVAWSRHPRLRGGVLALGAIGAAPALLAAALLQWVVGRLGVDVTTRLVDRFYSQERLWAACAPAPGADPAARPALGLPDGIAVGPRR